MDKFIRYVNIYNFKSITNLRLEDCRRINIFIGYPNVGKSNVLEALSLFSVPFLRKRESLNKLVRVKSVYELFHSLEDNCCEISTNVKKIELKLSPNLNLYHGDHEGKNSFYYHFTEEIKLSNKGYLSDLKGLSDESNIKRYVYSPDSKWKSNNGSQLLPPYGENIVDTLSYCSGLEEVKAFIKTEFGKYDLKLVLNKKDQSLSVQQNSKDDEIVLLLPYSSIADTLQRVIFYKVAIASNKNSVLLFEEPEAHAFPPYIGNIMQDVIEAKTNQFFIVTHSPFVIHDFLEYEHLRRETSIYLFDFKNSQTTVKRLTDEEMDEVYEYGIDLFFNIESFLE